ncbi:TAXI family TRAP transporter solute-binding subunit [Roseomonas sp. M0104]|uniref:TAXI family TRAP transporter solute-binding subunit n=1 Tax=Teichococcus coralli TaxID=2545983 RepID=A0A845B6A2_9PROT|nr:TAXI family TRAP transporter solute-binding subunit [Pseudoroseomonas coralli]MXP62731.1 TAXI family TRAP transporter solute-binding subunit [Pseudoroseomonas coralli]
MLSRRSLMLATAGAGWMLHGLRSAQAAEFINILTGGTSGVYYPLGVAISKLFAEKIDGVRPSVQATKGSVENLNLLQRGRGELALSLGDAMGFAWEGNAEAGFPQKLDKLRSVGAIYANYVQIAALRDSGIKTLADLKGKRLSVGAPASGTELNARAILAAAGLSYKDLGKVEYLPFGESVDLMKNRQLDATLQSAGLGVASILDLSTSVPINIVEVPKDVIAKVGAPYKAAIIPANTYTGQDAEVVTAAVPNYLVTRAGLADDLVYNMAKVIYENVPALVAAQAAAKGIEVESAGENPPIPLHPGAERYFKERKKA